MPHTRAIQRDRSKRVNGIPPTEEIVKRMEEVVQPAIYARMANYHAMGLRARILTLPVMVVFVLALIWQQVGSVREAVRVLHEEGMLWIDPIEKVSAQAMLERMTSLPSPHFLTSSSTE